MTRLILLALLATPSSAQSPSPQWQVEFANSFDSVSTRLACRRVSESRLECVDLDQVLRAQDAVRKMEAELEERRLRQETAWLPSVSL